MGADQTVQVAHAPWVDEPGAAHAVALEILLRGPIARSELARSLNLSAGSLTRITRPLIAEGLIAEVEVESSDSETRRAGRPTKPLDIVSSARSFVGLKITAESVTGAVTDLRAGVLDSVVRPLTTADPEGVLDVVVDVVRSLGRSGDAVSGLGVGLGGLVSGDGTVVSAPFLDWDMVPFKNMVQAATGLPTTVANDLIALTAYENWFGAGRGHERFAVITLGAGIGYGLVVNGDMVIDADSGLGLIGHWPIDPFGPVCPSGHRGCARSLLTSSAITKGVSATVGHEVTYDEALDLAASDPGARRIVDDAGRGLGRIIAAVCNLTSPECIVLGGEGVRLASVAVEAMDAAIRADRDPRASEIPIETTSGDDVKWARGAAVLAMRSYILSSRPA